MRLATVDELLRTLALKAVWSWLFAHCFGVVGNEQTFFAVTGCLPEFLDLDRLAALQFVQSRLSSGLQGCEETISNVIFVKQSLDVLPVLADALNAMNDGRGPANQLLRTIALNLQRKELKGNDCASIDHALTLSQAMREYIDRVVEPGVHKRAGAVDMRTERYFAVKAGQNGLLDVARKTYTEVLDDVQSLLSRYRSEYLMDALALKNNAKRGYYLCEGCSGERLPAMLTNPPVPSHSHPLYRLRSLAPFLSTSRSKLRRGCGFLLDGSH